MNAFEKEMRGCSTFNDKNYIYIIAANPPAFGPLLPHVSPERILSRFLPHSHLFFSKFEIDIFSGCLMNGHSVGIEESVELLFTAFRCDNLRRSMSRDDGR